jgi:hypothetical protein
MFSRWTQENFFRYLRQDYDLDKIFQYTVEQIDGNIKVVNPHYSNLSYHIKKTKEKSVGDKPNYFNWRMKTSGKIWIKQIFKGKPNSKKK